MNASQGARTAERATLSNAARPVGEMTSMTTEQQPPSDTDRIIAAQRDEGRKTRMLLTWIFIGIPVVGLAVWGLVALVGASSSSVPSGSSTSGACDPSTPYADIDLTVCPLSGPLLTDESMCSAYTAALNQSAPANHTNAAVYFTSEHQVADLGAFNSDCTGSPNETLGYTLQSEGLQP